MWSILADNGSPMGEATLCDEHYVTGRDYAEQSASNADDYVSLDWVRIGGERALANDVSCVECRLL